MRYFTKFSKYGSRLAVVKTNKVSAAKNLDVAGISHISFSVDVDKKTEIENKISECRIAQTELDKETREIIKRLAPFNKKMDEVKKKRDAIIQLKRSLNEKLNKYSKDMASLGFFTLFIF